MSHAHTGRRREYRARDDMAAHGWVPIMRAAASKGAADLLMAHEEHGAALVQVGSTSKALGPSDRARFVEACSLVGALPVLAKVVPRLPIRYWLVTAGPASTWEAWTP